MLRPLRRTAFGTLYAAELLLGLHGRKLRWWSALVMAMALQLFAPTKLASVAVLGAWVLLTDILSRSSLREVTMAIAIVGVSHATWAMALGATLRTSRVAELLICGSAYLGIQDAPLLNAAVAPGGTADVHLACVPIAAALLLFGWPRVQTRAA